ncbi:GyrI-like domain-containing protein [Cohnella terricola]|uniref:GyrI-like domain-containing protein n=1 Tax=Cohnella terricola TaxID=1289167 RepID=UPI001FE99AE6|nr:effector binding domain-containing protein [Cohnella terricola]
MHVVQKIELNEKKLVGYTVTASLNRDLEEGLVLQLRQSLLEKRHKIANQLDSEEMFLVQVYTDEEWTRDVPFESIVAIEVSDHADIPEDFIRYTIPSGCYFLITHRGPESEIGATYDFIREQGIGSTRAMDVEHWVNVSNLDRAESKINIYIPKDGADSLVGGL